MHTSTVGLSVSQQHHCQSWCRLRPGAWRWLHSWHLPWRRLHRHPWHQHRLRPCQPNGHIIGCALVGLGMFGACAARMQPSTTLPSAATVTANAHRHWLVLYCPQPALLALTSAATTHVPRLRPPRHRRPWRLHSVCIQTNGSAMALASSPTAAPPPLTWARPSLSSPAQLPSASAVTRASTCH